MYTHLTLVLQGQRQADLCEFKGSLSFKKYVKKNMITETEENYFKI